MKNFFLNLPQLGKGNWWVEVITTQPYCIYYFGPFANAREAKRQQPGYIQDLAEEGIGDIQTVVKQCHPTQLTIFEPDDHLDSEISPSGLQQHSGQFVTANARRLSRQFP